MEKFYENTYRGDLDIDGAIEHFSDSLAGKLDKNTVNERHITLNRLLEYYEAEWEFEDDVKLKVEISLYQTEGNVSDEVDYEWICTAYKVS